MSIMLNPSDRLQRYKPFQPRVDLARLSTIELAMMPALVSAVDAMEIPFWIQEYGEPRALLDSISDPDIRTLVRINIGPWDRLRSNEILLPGYGEKPLGANYYPTDLTVEEFEAAAQETQKLKSAFTMVRRAASGQLIAIPYHVFFQEYVLTAAEALRKAADICEAPDFKNFLQLRADALSEDSYRLSDTAWMELKGNSLEVLIGPLEIEDRLFGLKTAYSGAILVKDHEASGQLSRYVRMLPGFQESLPVPEAYKRERPCLEADLQVYDGFHFAGLDAYAMPRGVA